MDGKLDANEEKSGQVLDNARLARDGSALHVTTGPAVTYSNPRQRGDRNDTIKATFREPRYMSLNSHPHAYGIVIAHNTEATVSGLAMMQQR